ncbi:phosphotransferase [Lysobacter korlensis]|uniref:Phosphotransferase n=1 Tax=Lysobacter korlensis TaxID=553636 RepID=A0ABV6RZM5_9GAMM
MARTHLTLAALATSAVAGIDVVAASRFGTGAHGDFDSALLTDRDGKHWIIRVPRNDRAQAEQSADLVALRALSAGVRERLPFRVSTFAGQTPFEGTRACVYEFVYGSKVPLHEISPELATGMGRAIAAIHSLPTSFVADAGLPTQTALDSRRSCITVLERAAATGLVPAGLLARWGRATEEAQLWQFQPTVIHGSLSADSFLVTEGQVSGVLGWQDLRVGDPARDLFWVLGASDEYVSDAALESYGRERGNIDRQVRHRAMLYAELEIAKWLLHGTQERSTEIVDDAVQMLDGLIESIANDVMNPIGEQRLPAASVDEVEQLLTRSERAL